MIPRTATTYLQSPGKLKPPVKRPPPTALERTQAPEELRAECSFIESRETEEVKTLIFTKPDFEIAQLNPLRHPP